jgi:hypothetical protein
VCRTSPVGEEEVVSAGREEGGERVWEGEYGVNTMYTCMEMEK